jgi:hypothetical protein
VVLAARDLASIAAADCVLWLWRSNSIGRKPRVASHP